MDSPTTLHLFTAGAVALLTYTAMVRQFRFRNLRLLERKFEHLLTSPDALNKMTYVEAEEISQVAAEWDVPYMTSMSLQLALFQTYAIPTISKVLIASKQLSSPKTVARRAEDTTCILQEIVINGPDSPRGSLALSRMNLLHRRWGPSHISRDDLLFTLCLFIYEPIRLTAQHEWRALSPLEARARFVFWREVGARMGIAEIPETPEKLQQWRDAYQAEHMVFAQTNQTTADASMDLFIRPYPRFLRHAVKQALLVLVPEPVREAFGWERAKPAWLYRAVPAALGMRAWLIRNLAQPRRTPYDYGLRDLKLAVSSSFTAKSPTEERYQRSHYLFEPFYVRATLTSRLLARLFGWPLPGDEAFRPEGYKVEELGPEELMNFGGEEVREEARRMREKADGGRCPFALEAAVTTDVKA